jgi:hypothetical protein
LASVQNLWVLAFLSSENSIVEVEKEVGSVLYIVEESVTASVNAPNVMTDRSPEPVIIPIAAIPATMKSSDLPDEHRLQLVLPVGNNHIVAVNHQNSVKKSCKHCSSANVERRRRAGWEKLILPVMKKYRYLCYSCGREFYAKRAA